jgi:hypothetical protein
MSEMSEQAAISDEARALLGLCLSFLRADRRGAGYDEPSKLERDIQVYLDRPFQPAPVDALRARVLELERNFADAATYGGALGSAANALGEVVVFLAPQDAAEKIVAAARTMRSERDALRARVAELEGERDEARARVPATIYCPVCGESQPIRAHEPGMEPGDTEAWGDLVCDTCSLVVVTVGYGWPNP